MLGRIRGASGDRRGAERAFATIQELDPEDETGRYRDSRLDLIEIAAAEGDRRTVKRWARSYVRNYPESSEVGLAAYWMAWVEYDEFMEEWNENERRAKRKVRGCRRELNDFLEDHPDHEKADEVRGWLASGPLQED